MMSDECLALSLNLILISTFSLKEKGIKKSKRFPILIEASFKFSPLSIVERDWVERENIPSYLASQCGINGNSTPMEVSAQCFHLSLLFIPIKKGSMQIIHTTLFLFFSQLKLKIVAVFCPEFLNSTSSID